jgi:hypothetical protein
MLAAAVILFDDYDYRQAGYGPHVLKLALRSPPLATSLRSRLHEQIMSETPLFPFVISEQLGTGQIE